VSHDPKPPAGRKGERRPLSAPGTYWEYNDVRINQFSLALLHLFRRPLPDVFLESVLLPIGAGRDFRWEGYDDAWVEIDGRRVQSVPGGTHWGAGVTISARDQALVGQLLLDGGAHEGRQLVPADWVRRMHTPCAVAPFYGWLTWLNGEGRLFGDASRASWFMFGAGGHTVWIDPENEAVVVARWLDGAHSTEFVRRVAQAFPAGHRSASAAAR
jgi:CubicO group peptidase (beta-lactamase class C family)